MAKGHSWAYFHFLALNASKKQIDQDTQLCISSQERRMAHSVLFTGSIKLSLKLLTGSLPNLLIFCSTYTWADPTYEIWKRLG